MQRVRTASLQAGQVFAEGLFLCSGQLLLPSGTVLTEAHLDLMRRSGATQAIFAGALDDVGPGTGLPRGGGRHSPGGASSGGDAETAGPLGFIPPGEGDEAETPTHLELLRRGAQLAQILEDQMASMGLRVAPDDDPATAPAEPSAPADRPGWPDPAGLAEVRRAAVESLRHLLARIEAGVPVAADEFRPLLDGLGHRLERHPRRFTQLALLVKGRDNYLPDHAYSTAVMAMAMAGNLRWSPDDIRGVGLAGMLADVGMLLVPHRIRVGGCELTARDRARVHKHPLATLGLLETVTDLPPRVGLAAWQHHERENGSGYPRGTRRDAICDYARVLAVADSFAAAMSPRSYRKTKLPYIAMEETLRLASMTQLWTPACRALLGAAGLFPVGSQVKLSSGQRAWVVGSNPQVANRPLVQPLGDADQPAGDLVDLSQVPKEFLMVVQACSPKAESAGMCIPAA